MITIMTACVYCRIIQRQIPSRVVYETPQVICFLPQAPEAYGHTLIAPKEHYTDLYTVPAPLLAELAAAAQKLALHYQSQIDATGVNLLHASGTSAGQSVFHFHVHLFPSFDGDGLNLWPQLPPATFDLDAMLHTLKLEK